MSKDNGSSQIIDLKNEGSVKRVIGVVSGKGGVGKSFVTSRLASIFAKKGYTSAVLDADITGPSIPRCFGLKDKAEASENGIQPALSKGGIQVMSVNLLLDDESVPVVWRGPIIAGTVKQFWSEVDWKDVEYMFVDMPPGTGDVPLTVFQSLPVDGIIIVTSPSELVSMIVEKAVNMANTMEIPVLGIVENYSYIKCPDCGKLIYPFGEGKTDDVGLKYGIPVLSRLPMDSRIASAMDNGLVEDLDMDVLGETADTIEFLLRNVDHSIDSDDYGETHKLAIALDENEKMVGKLAAAVKFVIADTKGRKVLDRNYLEVKSAEEAVASLKSAGVDTIISNGVDKKLRNLLSVSGIAIIPILKSPVEDVIANFLDGKYNKA
jgi:hypothetical protein